MYALINKENMTVVAKHESASALKNFAWLELPHVVNVICLCDEPDDLSQFTDFQLKELYGALVGLTDLKGLGFSIEALKFLLFDAIEKVEPLDAVESELLEQASKVSKPYTIFKYVKGSTVARQMPDLYEPTGPVVERDVAFEAAVRTIAPVVRVVTVAEPAAAPPKPAPRRETVPRVPKPAVTVSAKPARDFSAVAPLAIKQPWL